MLRRLVRREVSRATVIGVAMTLVATTVLWAIPSFVLWYYADRAFVYLDAPTYRSYRLLGGAFGGLATGWVTGLNDSAGHRGAIAAFVGAAIVGGVNFVGTLVWNTLFYYSSPPIAYVMVRTGLVLLLLLPSFALGGFVGGLVGRETHLLARDVRDRVP